MKHKKTIGGLMILVSLALAGCNFGGSTSGSDSRGSDITTSEVTSTSDASSFTTDISDNSESTSEVPSEPELSGHLLRTVQDLNLLRTNPSDKFHLMNDIDLNGIEWEPIEYFSGEFFGHNHKIKNLTIVDSYLELTGFFAVIDGALIVDLTFEDVEFAVFGPAGPVAEFSSVAGVLAGIHIAPELIKTTYIENVHVTKSAEGMSVVNFIDDAGKPEDALEIGGGLLGISQGDLSIHNSSADIAISGAIASGGLVGFTMTNIVNISSSSFSGFIFGKFITGGIVGMSENSSITVFSSVNTGTISGGDVSTEMLSVVGGLLGGIGGGTTYVQNSSNTGEVTNAQSASNADFTATGGLVGFLSNDAEIYLTKVHNSGPVRSGIGNNVGGLIGFATGLSDLMIAKSYNSGNITGLNSVGGLVGVINSANNVSVANSYNNGVLFVGDLNDDNVGGAIGGFIGSMTDADITISSSYNAAPLHTPVSFAAGFIGNIYGGIFTIKDSLHIGEISGEQLLGTFTGQASNDVQVTNSYYNATFENSDGEMPLLVSLQGETIALGAINTDFFTATLSWDETIWHLVDITSASLPTLK